jgi:hypothetical protein
MNRGVSADKRASVLQSIKQFMDAQRARPAGPRICGHCGSVVLHVKATFFLLGSNVAGPDLSRNETGWNIQLPLCPRCELKPERGAPSDNVERRVKEFFVT